MTTSELHWLIQLVLQYFAILFVFKGSWLWLVFSCVFPCFPYKSLYEDVIGALESALVARLAFNIGQEGKSNSPRSSSLGWVIHVMRSLFAAKAIQGHYKIKSGRLSWTVLVARPWAQPCHSFATRGQLRVLELLELLPWRPAWCLDFTWILYHGTWILDSAWPPRSSKPS